MITLAIFIILFIGSFIIWKKRCHEYDSDDGWAILSIIVSCISAIVLLVMVIWIWKGKAEDRAFAHKVEAVRSTIASQRADTSLSDLERVQLTNTILAWNVEIADRKYWSRSQWMNIWYDRRLLDQLEPLK
jgi:hypothetical protein